MRSLFFFLYLMFVTSLIQAQYKDTIFALYMGREYGLVRSCYPNMITAPLYRDVNPIPGTELFSAAVGRYSYYGILDTSGKERTKMEYDRPSIHIDRATKKTYTYLKKPSEQILVDELGNIIGKGFPTIKEICGGYVVVEPDFRDTAERRMYYTDKDKYVKQGFMDLKGNWIYKPDLKQFYGIYGRLFYIQDHHKQDKGKLYDLKLDPLSDLEYDDVRFGYSLQNDSLKALKRIIVYNKEFIWLLDSSGKELKKEVHKKLPIDIKGYGDDRKSFNYNGNNIDKDGRDYDGAFIMEDYLIGFDSTEGRTYVYDRHGDLLFTNNYSNIFVPWVKGDNPVYKFVFAKDNTGIYLLNDKLEKKTPALQFVNTDEIYKDEHTQLFLCQKNKKYGLIDQTGKIIAPFIYKNEPSRYSRGVMKFYSTGETDYYSTTGEKIAKGADDAEKSSINPNIYIVNKGGSYGIFSGDPFKVQIPFGTYSSFQDYPQQKAIIAKKNEKQIYILDKDLRVLNKEPIEEFFTTLDSVTFSVRYANKKEQLLSYRSPDPKNSFDKIEDLLNPYENHSRQSKNHLFLVANNSKYGLANTKSDILVNTEWDTIISVGKCLALKKGRTYYISNEKFEIDRNMPFDSIIIGNVESYYQELDWRLFKIQVKKAGKWGVFDLAGHKWIIYPNFDNVVNVLGRTNFAQRYFSTRIDKWSYLVDPEKNIIYGEGFNDIIPITNHASYTPFPDLNPNLLVNKGNAKRDTSGKLIGGKYGIISPKGKMLHKCDADHLKPIAYTLQRPREHVFGYLWNIGGILKQYISAKGDSVDVESYDANGNPVIKKVLQGRYYGERIVGGKYGIVDANGKEVLPVIYDDMIFMFNGGEGVGDVRSSYSDTMPDYDHQISPVFLKKDGKWGAAELRGNIIVPVIYDSIIHHYISWNKKAMKVLSNGKIGYFDIQGKVIIPLEYSGEKQFGYLYDDLLYTLFQKNGTISNYTLSVLSSTRLTKYDENGNEYYVNDTITITQKSFTGGTYGFWDYKNAKWALDPVYEDIRVLQEFNFMDGTQTGKRTSVLGKYTDEYVNRIYWREPFEIKKDGKWGAFDPNKGIIILKPEFDDIKIENEEIITKQAGVEKRFTFEGKAK